MKPAIYAERLKALRAAVKSADLDAMIVLNRVNTRYLSGFGGSFSVLIVDRKKATLITDSRYAEIVEGVAAGNYKVLCQPAKDVADFYKNYFKKADYKRIGFEESITVREFESLGKRAEKSEFLGAEELVLNMRAIKTAEEVKVIGKAVALADKVMAQAIGMLKPGLLETELSLRIRRMFEDLGADGESFENIVASGPNSSRPHHHAVSRKMRKGDPVTIDLGGKIGGYCSDLTRTPVIGKPSREFEKIYSICLKANEAAIQHIRPGMTGKEADGIAREVISSAGYGQYFGHGLGHGVGLEIHEGPRLSPECESVLRPGMIVTIEPGIYIPGMGGVRIEDYAVITEKGVKVLSHAPKLLQIIPA